MKIKKITIDNIRCFDHLEIDFTGKNGVKDWIVVLGDNGVGKSTILRSIALGLTEESGASGLLTEMGDWVKRDAPENKGYVIIELEPFFGCTEVATIKTDFEIDGHKEVKVRQTVTPQKPNTFDWEDLFVCGYGASRSQDASQSLEDYVITDAIYTLFNYEADLQNPELIIRRLQTLDIKDRDIFSKLEHILMLEEGAITLEFNGIKVDGPWGKKMPIDSLSDGYRVILSMLTDSFGLKGLFEGANDKPNIEKVLDLEGIIIIDELEQHLHPRWQKDIIGLLHKQFPKVQFIISTHSPLCVIGTTDLKDEDCSIIALKRDEKGVKCNISNPPRGQRADQVLTSYLFDLLTSSDNALRSSMNEYSKLYLNKRRTSMQEKRMLDLHSWLDEHIGSPETELEKTIISAVEKALDHIIQEKVSNIRSPINFEVIKQLQD